MAWDKNQPDGSVLQANLVDDRIQDNNIALEAGLVAEHYFATGGDQHMRHKFGLGGTAARDAIADLVNDGCLWFHEDGGSTIPDGHAELSIYDAGNSKWLLASGRMMLELANAWIEAQTGYYHALSIGASVASDWALGNFFSLGVSQNFTLSNPTNLPADGPASEKGAGTWVYELTQDASGSRIITLGSNFVTSFGVALVLTTDANAVDLLICTLRSDGKIHADLVRDSK